MKHEFEWPQAVQESANKIAESMNVCARIHPEDFIFRFIYDHPGFDSKESAIAYYFNDGRNSAEKVTALARKFLVSQANRKIWTRALMARPSLLERLLRRR